MNGFKGLSGLNGGMMGDYRENLALRILPATGGPTPYGPDNVPITAPVAPPTTDPATLLNTAISWLQKIFTELVRQNTASIPKVLSANVTSAGQTLDWSMLGFADRLMLENLGPDPVWLQFDQSGGNVTAAVGGSSFELPANSTLNPMLCRFSKIGLKTASGHTAAVYGIAFHGVAGNQQGVIS